jgi:hypothetical protein
VGCVSRNRLFESVGGRQAKKPLCLERQSVTCHRTGQTCKLVFRNFCFILFKNGFGCDFWVKTEGG